MSLSTTPKFALDSNLAGVQLTPVIASSTPITIVDGSATSLFTALLPSNGRCGGAFFYTIEASDGTDYQAMTGMVTYAAVSKATVQTLTITSAAANDAKALSSGTLTVSFTIVAGTGLCTIKVTPTGSLTETTYTITLTVMPTVGAVTMLS